MKLYAIRAYHNKEDEGPDRTYIITADSDEEAEEILAKSAYASEHEKFELSAGATTTDAPGPRLWGWTGGARLLKKI